VGLSAQFASVFLNWFYSHPNGGNKDDWGFSNGACQSAVSCGVSGCGRKESVGSFESSIEPPS
jgi:hypothetical protein